jgi:hydroxyacylglutathione hydrolase
MNLIPLPAFADNYIWLLHDGHQALVVDPGDANPVLESLQRLGLRLDTILVTHHHADHTGGVAALRQATGARVFGPARETMPEPITRLQDADRLSSLGLEFTVLEVPGHTAGHIAYFCANLDGAPLLFCGDTLFSAGCGRLFEGSPAQMLASLDRLSALPDSTRVCCTHEYTQSNLKFACHVDPTNQALASYAAKVAELRVHQRPTLPTSLMLEHQINPFLRTRHSDIISAVRGFEPAAHDEVSVFAALREWKNKF